jgi:putative transposase
MSKKYSESQILGTLKQAESGVPVTEMCLEHGMSNASFYKWRSKYGGMDASMIAEMKSILEENKRLKRMCTESQMQSDLLKECLKKSAKALLSQSDCKVDCKPKINKYTFSICIVI